MDEILYKHKLKNFNDQLNKIITDYENKPSSHSNNEYTIYIQIFIGILLIILLIYLIYFGRNNNEEKKRDIVKCENNNCFRTL